MIRGSDDFVELLDRERAKRNKEIADWLKDAIPPIPPLDIEAKQEFINFIEREMIQAIRRNPTNIAITVTFGHFSTNWEFGIGRKTEWTKLSCEWADKYGKVQCAVNRYEKYVSQQLFKKRIVDFVESVKQVWEKKHSDLAASIESTDQKIILVVSTQKCLKLRENTGI